MKDSTKRRTVIGRTLILAGAFFGGLLKGSDGKTAHPSGQGATLRGNAPIYNPRRGKFKGYLRNKTSFNKNR